MKNMRMKESKEGEFVLDFVLEVSHFLVMGEMLDAGSTCLRTNNSWLKCNRPASGALTATLPTLVTLFLCLGMQRSNAKWKQIFSIR